MKINRVIKEALIEDRAASDITTRSLIAAHDTSEARIIAKEDMCVSGLAFIGRIFHRLEASSVCRLKVRDGAIVKKGAVLMTVKAHTRTLLSGERVALNFLGHLSGIATETRRYVNAVKGFPCKVYDTRKTIPGLRALQKYAVLCGGGRNHRGDLKSMVLIKDNHLSAIAASTSIAQAIALVHKKTRRPLMVEVETLGQFKEALAANAELILLDNMAPAMIKRCVALKKKKKGKQPHLEASGNITLSNIKRYAATGVERISVGALTHTTRCADVSMEIL